MPIIKKHGQLNLCEQSLANLLSDTQLSWGEIGLMCYLLQLPEEKSIQRTDLMGKCRTSAYNLKSMLANLEKLRYINRYPVHVKGKLGYQYFVYCVSDVPMSEEELIKSITKDKDVTNIVTQKGEKQNKNINFQHL